MPKQLSIVKFIANLAPWLAPIPSAYFMIRSSVLHLGIPLIIGIVVGLIVETLGFSTVHLYLMLQQWNLEKKKSDPAAPEILALVLVAFYITITITLTVVLEINPALAIYAPAIFPLLALVGAFILALISQQEQRQSAVQQTKLERSSKRHTQPVYEQDNLSVLPTTNTLLDLANKARGQKKDTLLERLENAITEHPEMGVTELKTLLGIKSRTTVYNYLNELKNRVQMNSI